MKYYTPVAIRFRDLDSLGHVNNAVFISYVEEGRIGYFKKVIGRNHDWSKFGTLLAHTSIDYHHPIYLEDELLCGVEITSQGEKSFEVQFELVVKKEDGSQTRCASGKNVLVCFDNIAFKTAPIPDEWREKVAAFNLSSAE